ncbi:hypothetical protein CBS101457_003173 [Exobasidium rhododendri]|nr:hypothetical protein CBS101457_003173 [Exobasidium rhododendri]
MSSSLPEGSKDNLTKDVFAQRRQERMRGAGKHEIIQRIYQFGGHPSSSTSSSSTNTTPIHTGITRMRSGSLSSSVLDDVSERSLTPRRSAGHDLASSSSTPAMSVRSGRERSHPISSPSKYIDPRLLADQDYKLTEHARSQDAVPGKDQYAPTGTSINHRRQERMRGAGTHQIKPNSYHFSRRSSEASSSAFGELSTSGFLERALADPSSDVGAQQGQADSREVLPEWIEQRRMERRRGAGTHAIERLHVAFGVGSARLSNASSTGRSASILEEGEEGQEEEEAEREDLLSQGDDTATIHSGITTPTQSARTRTRQQDRGTEIDEINFGEEYDDYPHNDADVDAEADELMSVSRMEVDASTETDSPRSRLAHDPIEKRKRQASPRRTVQRRATKRMLLRRKGTNPPKRRVVDIASTADFDETMVGQADLTMEEQRGAAFMAPEPPIWTFPKKPVTMEELTKMKQEVKSVVTLALGNEAGVGRVKFNDADVLYVTIRDAIQAVQRGQAQPIQDVLDELLHSIRETFTYLSKQSAERSRLIHHLQQARKKNLQIRKHLFKKRSHVLQIQRTMQVLKTQELKRVQREENEEKSLDFLGKLAQVSHEWC